MAHNDNCLFNNTAIAMIGVLATLQHSPGMDLANGLLINPFLLHPDTLILPSLRKPFRNVHHRLRQLAAHHSVRLNLILDKAGAETSAGALIDVLFTPGLDGHQIGFAMGEAIAHLNHLVTLGHMKLVETPDQVRYRRVSASDARVEPGFE